MTTATKERKTTRGTSLAVADLKRALQTVSKAVASHSSKPALTNVLFSGETLSATDLELRIDAPLDCYDGPAMLLPYSRLWAIVQELPGGDAVTLTHSDSVCVISGKRVEYRLPTEDPNEFPVSADVKTDAIARLPGSQFVSLVQSVKFATAADSSRYALGGVLMQLDRPTGKESRHSLLSFVGTDGHRLCVAPCKISQDTDPCGIIVPKRTVDVLCSLAKKDDEVQLSHAGNEFIATVTDASGEGRSTVIRSPLVQGRFPKWEDVTPDRKIKASQVMAGELLHACRQAAICTSEASRGVTFTIDADGLHLSSQSSEHGQAKVTAELIDSGRACTVKVDPAFITQWLDCKSFDVLETVEFEAEDAVSAVVLRVQDCRCVIMPLANE